MPARTHVDRSLVPRAALDLCARLSEFGHGAWIVGGCVRDHLMSREVADWDLCTTARPDELTTIFPRAIPTGIAHGTVTVMVDKVPYEVTTLRGETTYTDGRRPDAVFFVDDVTHDLARRDFTVNAIAWEPARDSLIDPFGGIADLDAGVIRAVGDPNERFREDGLRVLRAARFVATLEFALDPATHAAIEPNLPTFRKVSAERVREEWVKTMKARAPSLAFEVMRESGILGEVCPPLLESVGCTQNRWHAYDVWTHTMKTLDGTPREDPVIRFAALLHDIAKPRTRKVRPDNGEATFFGHESVGAEMADDFLKRYRFSNDERARVTHLVRHHLIQYDDAWSDAAVRRFVRRVGVHAMDDLLSLCRADSRGKGRDFDQDLTNYDRLRARIDALTGEGSVLTTSDLAIDGNDLQRELGIPPSRRIGQILETLLERVTEDPALNTPETLMRLVRELL